MTDRERLIESIEHCEKIISELPCGKCKEEHQFLLECLTDYKRYKDLEADGRIIVPPCKVGDKVAVRACCECVQTIPDNDECRYICPFEDDCECDDCDNANERIFNTEIDSIFNNGFGWKITFKNLGLIEADFTDIGVSFFVGENAEQQVKEYEKARMELKQ